MAWPSRAGHKPGQESRPPVSTTARGGPHNHRVHDRPILPDDAPPASRADLPEEVPPNAPGGPRLRPARGLSLWRLWQHGRPQERLLVLGAWLLSAALSAGLGLLAVAQHWQGLPLSFGGVPLYLTVYPPLVICLFWAVSLGWWWGAVPAYLATLILALHAGMPWGWALLFACADPLGFAVLGLAYHAIPLRRDLRDLSSLLFYVLMNFISSVLSSVGALMWCYTNQLDRTAQLPVWQGWWLGGFLQNVLIVGPLLALMLPRLQAWLEARPELLTPRHDQPRRLVLQLIGTVVAGVLGFGFVTLHLATADLSRPLAVATLTDTAWALMWVSSLLVLSGGVFGYLMFNHWLGRSRRLVDELARANERLAALAGTDDLTGLPNRRAAEARLQQLWQHVRRYGEPAAVVMLDVDRFKSINDTWGHATGDAVLRALAQALRETTRAVDLAGRWGGEEFLVLLPRLTPEAAHRLAERLREQAATVRVLAGGQTVPCTVSLGVAMADPADDGAEAWLRRADEALYQAKSGGRNRVVMAPHAAHAPAAPPRAQRTV